MFAFHRDMFNVYLHFTCKPSASGSCGNSPCVSSNEVIIKYYYSELVLQIVKVTF